MNDSWKIIIGVGFVLALILGSIWVSVSVWNECRDQGNSFFYCLRLVSK